MLASVRFSCQLTKMLPRAATAVSHSHHAHDQPQSTCEALEPSMYTEKKSSMEQRHAESHRSNEVNRLVWIDCEMSGLDVSVHHLLQIAVLVTEGDGSLTELGRGVDIVIHQDEQVLSNMTDWCKNAFEKNGLTTAVRNSTTSLEQAESQVLDYIKKYTQRKACPLAGNSVGYDRRFIDAFMPRLSDHLHYRTVDVSTVKELCRRWYPREFGSKPRKRVTHRALDDIRESVDELRYYKRSVFK